MYGLSDGHQPSVVTLALIERARLRLALATSAPLRAAARRLHDMHSGPAIALPSSI